MRGAWARLLIGCVLAAALPAAGRTQPAAGSLIPCPETGASFEGGCACWSPRAAPVWGTDVYAAESAVCAAALHAGVIARAGGTVRVVPAPGQPRYAGSARNGIASQDRGASARSFRVERYTENYGVPPAR